MHYCKDFVFKFFVLNKFSICELFLFRYYYNFSFDLLLCVFVLQSIDSSINCRINSKNN